MKADLQNTLKGQRAFVLAASVVLFLLGLTIRLSLHFRAMEVAEPSTADVRQELPEYVGDWKGERLYYCQNESCMRSFPEHELDGTSLCPVCSGRLDQVSLGERNILPPDTIISRRMYQNKEQKSITVTVVISGSERRSIHRPQQCLPAQGFAIDRSSVLSVPLAGRSPLKLMLIRAQKGNTPMLMVYWFVGGGHETYDHFQRMAFMAWDNLFHNVRPRWAYVSLQISSNEGERISEKRLIELVQQLYPLLKPTVSVRH